MERRTLITYKFRLKSKNLTALNRMAGAVNFSWNYCNDAAFQFLVKKGEWLSDYELQGLTAGCGRALGLNSQSIKVVCREYAIRRNQCKKPKLAWRSKSRSLGWVPFIGVSIKVRGDVVTYNKTNFRFWVSREIEGTIKSGSFNQDSKGNWYVNFRCEVPAVNILRDNREVGIDLGLKTLATLSDGKKIDRENLTTKYASRLATAMRAKKTKRVKAIHAKVRNSRKDFNHKETTKLVNSYGSIVVGDVSPSKLKKTKMAKSVSDAGWSSFKTMLAYKAISLGVEYKEVNEKFSTVTCSSCFQRTGPSGLSAIGVRAWICKCGASHDRDVNAAKNILRFGHESPIKGVLLKQKDAKGER